MLSVVADTIESTSNWQMWWMIDVQWCHMKPTEWNHKSRVNNEHAYPQMRFQHSERNCVTLSTSPTTHQRQQSVCRYRSHFNENFFKWSHLLCIIIILTNVFLGKTINFHYKSWCVKFAQHADWPTAKCTATDRIEGRWIRAYAHTQTQSNRIINVVYYSFGGRSRDGERQRRNEKEEATEGGDVYLFNEMLSHLPS